METGLNRKTDILGLVGWLVATFAISWIGARASIEASTFYGQLVQPAWSPPAWLFGPVWTVLYVLMGVAAWLVWRAGGFRERVLPLSMFGLQLLLNALWSWLFFGWKLGGIALAEVLLLWLAIAATIALFWRVRPLAGALLIPYLLWVSFATAFNYSLWQLNPGLLG